MPCRLSVCYGFAGLMEALCSACGVECKAVTGFGRGYGGDSDRWVADTMKYKADHKWNAVKVYCPRARNEVWLIIDPTWCAGSVDGKDWVKEWNPEHYMVAPSVFALTHYPEDAVWTLLPEAERPTWRAFITSVKLSFPVAWELGILPVTHKRERLPVPSDRQLRIVLKAYKPAVVYAKLNGGAQVDPEVLATQDDDGGKLLAFNFRGLPDCKAAYNSICFYGAPQRYNVPYHHVLEYAMWDN